jgi:DNA-binding Lrp family transcriptional regulator
MLRPQDLAAAVVLALPDMSAWTYASLAARLELSASEVHAAIKRASMAGLVRGRAVDRRALLEFLEHGVRYAFYAIRGAPTRGVPTGVLAPPLDALVSAQEGPVWPSSDGTTRGYALAPLYRTAPAAAQRDPSVHEVLALIDAVREGGTRERELAMRKLRQRLERPPKRDDDG